ncbi:MAG: hypothetical protein IKS08_00360 [Alphaproteobacteria bacterium]|nr:hypothetical protein [Alphaproteobacteria bacterium]
MKRIISIIAMTVAIPCIAIADNEPSPTTTTSVSYVTRTTQPMLEAKSGDKVVTYGTTNGVVGTRNVLDDLDGTTTTDTNLATAEALETAIGEKQSEFINLSDRNVVTYSGQSYTVTTTPIYDDTVNKFSNGLVDADTLNSAMTAAANAEFTAIEDPAGTLWQINDAPQATLETNAYLPANIAGTSYCYKSHSGSNNTAGQCGNAYTAMQKGEWGVVFPYGTVTGISVCSNIEPSVQYGSGDDKWYQYGQVSTNQSGVQSQYDTWVSNGRPATPVGGYCYCKLTNPSISAARWVFWDSSSVSYCARACASRCAHNVRNDSDFRGAVFGAAAN